MVLAPLNLRLFSQNLMHKNPAWLAFLATTTLIVLWFSGTSCYRLYHYNQLSAQTHSSSIEWTMEKKASDRYFLKASYHYQINGKNQLGETLFNRTIYRNPWAATQAISTFEKTPWIIWYSPKNISYSSLNHAFPMKSLISTAILWGLLLYFTWLGYRVQKYQIPTK